MPEVDQFVGEQFEGVMHWTEAIEKRFSKRRKLSSHANTRSIVRNRSLKIAFLKKGLRPRLGCFLARGFGLILGIMPRLKIALRFSQQSYVAIALSGYERRDSVAILIA